MDVCGVGRGGWVRAARSGSGAGWWPRPSSRIGGVADYALAGLTGVFDAPPEFDDVEAAAFTLPFPHRLPGGAAPGQAPGGERSWARDRLAPPPVGTAIIQLGNAAGAHVLA